MTRRVSEAELRAQIPNARAAARRAMRAPWWPVLASYRPATDEISIGLRSGATVNIPRRSIRWLKNLTAEELRQVELSGEALRWNAHDIDISVPGLLVDVLGTDFVSTELGRIGGSKRSKAKAAAARANGRKGGRPRKQKLG